MTRHIFSTMAIAVFASSCVGAKDVAGQATSHGMLGTHSIEMQDGFVSFGSAGTLDISLVSWKGVCDRAGVTTVRSNGTDVFLRLPYLPNAPVPQRFDIRQSGNVGGPNVGTAAITIGGRACVGPPIQEFE